MTPGGTLAFATPGECWRGGGPQRARQRPDRNGTTGDGYSCGLVVEPLSVRELLCVSPGVVLLELCPSLYVEAKVWLSVRVSLRDDAEPSACRAAAAPPRRPGR